MPRRVVFKAFGDVSVLGVEEGPPAPLGEQDVRIAAAFAGVNYADVIARRGFYKWAPPPPTCVGFEVAGTVVERGAQVVGHPLGSRVLAITRFGGYADEVVVDARRAFAVPPGKSLEEAAALPAVSLTAWHALHDVARVRRGESILIQAVAGGVGLAALQIAKDTGLVTFGTASTDEKLGLAVKQGLDHPINYTTHDFEKEVRALTSGRGVDRVLDSLGGRGLRKGYRCLAPGGLIVSIGAAQVAPESRSPRALLGAARELLRGGIYHPFKLIEENRGIAGVQVLLLWDDLPLIARGMASVIAAWERGAITPFIDGVFPLEAAGEAHLLLENRKTRGKLLLSTG